MKVSARMNEIVRHGEKLLMQDRSWDICLLERYPYHLKITVSSKRDERLLWRGISYCIVSNEIIQERYRIAPWLIYLKRDTASNEIAIYHLEGDLSRETSQSTRTGSLSRDIAIVSARTRGLVRYLNTSPGRYHPCLERDLSRELSALARSWDIILSDISQEISLQYRLERDLSWEMAPFHNICGHLLAFARRICFFSGLHGKGAVSTS